MDSLRKSIGPNSIRDPVTGFTCLHHASLNGHAECVRLILGFGAKLNAVDYKGSSALHLAAWAGNLDVVRILLSYQHGQSPPKGPVEQGQQQENDANRQSPGGKQLVEIDLCNNDNQTPLSLAAQFGHTQVVAELVARGANVHSRNNQLESPLDLACLNGRLETVDLLLSSAPSLVSELKRDRSAVPAECGLFRTSAGSQAEETGAENVAASSSPQSARRSISAGWSTLLRGAGRRESSAAAGGGGKESNQQQSPLQRFTVASLSMRGPKSASPSGQQSESLSAIGRRATLAANNNQATRPMLGQRAKQISSEADYYHQSNQQHRRLSDLDLDRRERLLDHSPLHYAVRRGHAMVVHLLLGAYGANLLQVTACGSVLHEIALNNGKHSEMISLLFSYLANNVARDKHQMDATPTTTLIKQQLDKFLNLKNAQQKSVFEVLNEINNRSAQEMKRLIYESSEQIHRQLGTNDCTSSASQQQPGNSQLLANQMNTFAAAHSPASAPSLANSHPTQQFTSSQQQQQQQYFIHPQHQINRNASAINAREAQQRQFSDIQQINSFVTMKRAPKQRGPATGVFTSNHDHQAANFHHQQTLSTQTIDRRANKSSEAKLRQMQQQAHEHQRRQQQFAAMTRSVSNLYRCPSSGNNQQQVNWVQGAADWQNGDFDGSCRKRRSKSRDLGSLLMEAKQQQQQPLPQQVRAAGDSQQLVRSQTDCSHLMGRLFGEQVSSYSLGGPTSQKNKPTQSELHQHSAAGAEDQVDWTKTINRHYHVYEQEFYPPRLLSAGAPAQQPRQVVAVVPPLNRQQAAELAAGGHLRASTRSTASSASARLQNRWPNADGQQSADVPAQFAASAQVSGADSRLSLNLEAQQQVLQHQQQQQQQQQHNPMDRFLSRHSRKLQNEAQPSPTSQRRQDLLELQRRLAVECNNQSTASQAQQHQVMPSMPSSYSLESHLSESHLFETTRQALMEDFDRMIGQELLSNSGGQQPADRLTGVSLDMDSRGERLTVSGTRLTMPPPPPPPSTCVQSRSGSNRSLASHSSERGKPTLDCQSMSSTEQQEPARLVSPRSIASTDASSSMDLQQQIHREIPPPKPPRLSLLGKQKTCPSQRSLANQGDRRSVIYDLPAAPSSAGSAGSQGGEPLGAQQRARSQQFSSSGSSRHAPLTEPPKERPPPPPSQQSSPQDAATLAKPLHVYPPNASAGTGSLTNSCGSSSSSNARALDDQPQTLSGGGLLKVANQPSAMRSADADSGVGTSNSPASTGHESEEMDASAMANPLDHLDRGRQSGARATGETTAPAVVRHFVRAPQKPPVRPPLPSGYQVSRRGSGEQIDESPPSPKTAQLCIEEALMPLAKTADVANQTNRVFALNKINSTSRLVPSYSSSDLVDRWLVQDGGRQLGPEQADAADYENCRQLQRQLRNARCRSIGNLLMDECALSSGDTPPSPQPTASSLEEQDDEDYAAESASSTTTTTTTSGLCPGDVSNSGSPLSVSKDEEEEAGNRTQASIASSSDCSQRKELTIKIVLDANGGGETGDGDEVFYVNPLELKKIAMKRSQTDAETLTDEELCAAVDKDSGFIRFTLRKRRNQGGNNRQQVEPQRDSKSQLQTTELEEARSPTLSASSKKAKLNEQATETNSDTKKEDQCKQIVSPPSQGVELTLDRAQENGLISIQDLNNNTKDQATEARVADVAEVQVGVAATTMQKQMSTESSASEIEMDTSTSSSSKDSIKSIVSQAVKAPESDIVPKQAGRGETPEVEVEISPAPKEALKINEKHRRVSLPAAKPCGSLVSEVAKRLEAAVAAQGGLHQPGSLESRVAATCEMKPIAAARRINGRPVSTHTALRQVEPAQADQIKGAQLSPGRKAASPANFVPVKSVCWPPKNTSSVRNSVELSLAPVTKRWPHSETSATNTASKCSTTQQAQDENRMPAALVNNNEVVQQSIPTTNKTRPKPAPPVKPAKLANLELNCQRL